MSKLFSLINGAGIASKSYQKERVIYNTVTINPGLASEQVYDFSGDPIDINELIDFMDINFRIINIDGAPDYNVWQTDFPTDVENFSIEFNGIDSTLTATVTDETFNILVCGDSGPGQVNCMTLLRNIRGHQGEQGDTGAIGSQGIQGVTGPTGDIGPQGVTGPTAPLDPIVFCNQIDNILFIMCMHLSFIYAILYQIFSIVLPSSLPKRTRIKIYLKNGVLGSQNKWAEALVLHAKISFVRFLQ